MDGRLPSAIANLTRDVAASGANSIAVRSVTQLDTNLVPAAVFFSERWITEVVLPAQLIGDRRGGWIEVARIAHQLGAPAAVVGKIA